MSLSRVTHYYCILKGIILLLLLNLANANKPKILCLHGGGGSASGFEQAISELENALSEFEFVYAQAPYGSNQSALWIKDPPGGKGEPTTDPKWADESIEVLDTIRENNGPFYAILGYSQGAAFVPVYLSRVPNGTFQMAITFCGYLATTHLGLLGAVNDQSPFGDVSSMAWMGGQDYVISNSMTRAMANKFTDAVIIKNPSGYHVVPGSNDPTFDQVLNFIRDGPPPDDNETTCKSIGVYWYLKNRYCVGRANSKKAEYARFWKIKNGTKQQVINRKCSKKVCKKKDCCQKGPLRKCTNTGLTGLVKGGFTQQMCGSKWSLLPYQDRKTVACGETCKRRNCCER